MPLCVADPMGLYNRRFGQQSVLEGRAMTTVVRKLLMDNLRD